MERRPPISRFSSLPCLSLPLRQHYLLLSEHQPRASWAGCTSSRITINRFALIFRVLSNPLSRRVSPEHFQILVFQDRFIINRAEYVGACGVAGHNNFDISVKRSVSKSVRSCIFRTMLFQCNRDRSVCCIVCNQISRLKIEFPTF